MNRPEEGISYVKKSVEVNPYQFKSFMALGDSYAGRGMDVEACENYRAALSLASEHERGSPDKNFWKLQGEVARLSAKPSRSNR